MPTLITIIINLLRILRFTQKLQNEDNLVGDTKLLKNSNYIEFYLCTTFGLNEISKRNLKEKFDKKKPVKFLVHGWLDGKESSWVEEMYEVMASKNLWNVVLVDWAPLSHGTYKDAELHVGKVAEELEEFIMFLIDFLGVSQKFIHCIGHGLGGRIVAEASVGIMRRTGGKIWRLTGLDSVIFEVTGADFVDVIHTNGGNFGEIEPFGDVDFYVNGGIKQIGCSSNICSHTRACEYWIASIRNPRAFKAYNYRHWYDYLRGKRNKLIAYPMGIDTSSAIPQGVYIVDTTDAPPHIYTKHITL